MASQLFNGASSPVTAALSGSTITLTSKEQGSGANYSVSYSSTNDQPGTFAQPSFTASGPSALSGGVDGYTMQTPASTFYTYNALDNLTHVEQHGGTTDTTQWRPRDFSYDSLSQLLSASNPESGTILYAYDDDGNLVTKTAPLPNQQAAATVATSYVYDVLHRLTQKSYNDNLTATVKYGYDGLAPSGCTPPALTPANPASRRTSMCDASGASAWSYDAMGRAVAEKRTIAGVTKTTSYSYNLDGSMATLTYPSGRTVTYDYSPAGRALSAKDLSNGINYATAASYAPQGALAGVTYGNSGTFAGIVTTNSYNQRLQPSLLSAQAPSETVLSLSYDFHLGVNDNGNVYQITNHLDGVRPNRPHGSVQFAYDALNRLSSVNSLDTDCTVLQPSQLTVDWGDTFSYDAWGNLLGKSPSRCTAENLDVTVNGKNQITNTGFCYDSAGNLLGQVNCSTYAYDAENRLKQTAGVTYTYDGDGKRVSKSTGKLYWTGMGSDPLDESDAAGTVNEEYVFFNGKRVARVDLPSATVHYYFSDHLGSASVVTSASGAIEEESDYYPFGGERAITSGPNPYKFTGKERDPESGLDDFGARYYASSLGRFTSPDYFANDTHGADPQSWNLYTYARNNPVRFVDPTGEEIENTDDKKHKLSKSQMKKIEKDLQEKTGLKSIHFDKNGKLVYDKDEKASGGSEKMRDQITAAIDNKANIFKLGDYSGSDQVQFAATDEGNTDSKSGVTTFNVKIDFADFSNAQDYSDPRAMAAYSIGLTLSHEINHKFPTFNNDDNGARGVIDYVNGMRTQLGLPTRDPGSHQGTCSNGMCSIPFHDHNGQEHLLKWQMEYKRSQ